jgi:hypothetical protein
VLVVESTHVVPLQQPSGHVVASHVTGADVQLPPEHVWPAEQLTHSAPAVPQAALVAGSIQVVPLQQPEGQLLASQTVGADAHVPAVHDAPAGQVTHEAPPVPQADALVADTQAPCESQQPEAHVVASQAEACPQTPSTQSCPLSQLWQAAPPTPHADRLGEAHLPSLVQQPDGHVPAEHDESQLSPAHVEAHVPFTHALPEGHAAHAVPPRPHALAEGVRTHSPAALQQPSAQVVSSHSADSVEQTPSVHVWLAAQATQARPEVPHWAAERFVTHMPASVQHPAGQVAAEQAPPASPPVPPSPTLQLVPSAAPQAAANVAMPMNQVSRVSVLSSLIAGYSGRIEECRRSALRRRARRGGHPW